MSLTIQIGKVNEPKRRMFKRHGGSEKFHERYSGYNQIHLETNPRAPKVYAQIPPSYIPKELRINQLHNSYGGWANFLDRYPQLDPFLDSGGLVPTHGSEHEMEPVALRSIPGLPQAISSAVLDNKKHGNADDWENDLKWFQFWLYYAESKYGEKAYIQIS